MKGTDNSHKKNNFLIHISLQSDDVNLNKDIDPAKFID